MIIYAPSKSALAPELYSPAQKPLTHVTYNHGYCWLLNEELVELSSTPPATIANMQFEIWDGQYALSGTSSSNSFSASSVSGDVYGLVLHFWLDKDDLTSSATTWIIANFGTVQLAAGSYTTYITGETITLDSSTSRHAITETILKDRQHTFALIRNGSNYDMWIDGVRPTMTRYGADIPLITATQLDIALRKYTATPNMRLYSAQLITDPGVYLDGEQLTTDPYALVETISPLWMPVGVAGAGGVTLTIGGSAHAHAADNLDLTQAHGLVLQDAAHVHAADILDLTQAHGLVLQDAAHAHVADNIALTQASILVLQDSAHAHAADNLDLTQAHGLVLQDAGHAHAADNVVLQAAGTLEIAGGLHAHAADNIALTQAHILAIADAAHAHAADNVTLDSGAILVIQDADHGHATDNPALTQAHVLAVADALHAHAADNVGITVDHATLIISGALHAHVADQCNVSEFVTVIETPRERIFLVQEEGRLIAISAEPRIITIQ